MKNLADLKNYLTANPSEEAAITEILKHWAIFDHRQLCELLANKYPNLFLAIVKKINTILQTDRELILIALSVAVDHACKEVLSYLIKHKLQPKDVSMMFHQAVKDANRDRLKLLLEVNVDPNLRSPSNEIPLHLVAKKNGLTAYCMIADLIDHKADVNTVDSNGKSLCHIAVEQSSANLLLTVLEANAVVNVRNAKGQTPCHIAAAIGDAPILSLLIEAKADVDAKDNVADTAYMLAQRNSHTAITKLLIEANASVSIAVDSNDNITQQATNITSTQNMACELPRSTVVDSNVNSSDAPITPTAVSDEGANPLHYAALYNNTAAVKQLLGAKVNPSLADNDSKKPSELAKDQEAIQLLQNGNKSIHPASATCTLL